MEPLARGIVLIRATLAGIIRLVAVVIITLTLASLAFFALVAGGVFYDPRFALFGLANLASAIFYLLLGLMLFAVAPWAVRLCVPFPKRVCPRCNTRIPNGSASRCASCDLFLGPDLEQP